jgi:hypothetical protein
MVGDVGNGGVVASRARRQNLVAGEPDFLGEDGRFARERAGARERGRPQRSWEAWVYGIHGLLPHRWFIRCYCFNLGASLSCLNLAIG